MPQKLLFKLASRSLLQPLHRWRRGMTLGTRTAVFDAEGRVMLVRHTYAEGWMLPGGGVERGETIFESAVREVEEEASIIAEQQPVLAGFCNNDEHFPGDHIAVLELRKFRQVEFVPTAEIAEARFFAVAELPPETTGGTRRRIKELTQGLPISPRW